MSGMAQPYQGLGVELARSLAAQSQSGADLMVEGRGITVQTVASGNDVAQTGCQALEQRVEGILHLNCFPDLRWVWRR
jgi:hypothetical protein